MINQYKGIGSRITTMNGPNEEMFDIDVHKQTVLCIPSIPKLVTTEHNISQDNSFEFGKALESYFPLLELVFKYLEVQDLDSAKLVNPTWNTLGDKELQKRISPTWISVCYNPSLSVQMSPGFTYHNAALGIIVYNPHNIKLKTYLCIHDTPDFYRMTFAVYLSTFIVPKNVQYCAIACTEVLSINNECKPTSSIYQGLFIPVIPNVRSTMFHYSPTNAESLDRVLKENERVKCLLIFTQKYKSKPIASFLSKLTNCNTPRKVAVGGGLIKSVKSFETFKHQRIFYSDSLFCIAFFEEEGSESNFNAYSCVISNSVEEEKQLAEFEAEIIRIKGSAVLRKYGLVFTFCCYAKSLKMEERQLISKHFPKYSVLGLEVDGEIGWNSIFKEDNIKQSDAPETKKRKVVIPKTLHGWTTVLVLITWGKKI